MNDRCVASVAVLIGVATCTACTGTTVAPDTAAVPKLSITVDSGAEIALSFASVVHFDALQSTGSGLAYRIDFGDGQSTAKPVADHIYAVPDAPGYPLHPTLTLTDRSGHTSVRTLDLRVLPAYGFWLVDQGGGEAQWLLRQADRRISGTYGEGSGAEIIEGEVRLGRQIVMSTDGGKSFAGTFDSTGQHMQLAVTGGINNGRSIRVRRYAP